MEWMKSDEINGNWREDLEKRIEMQNFYDKNYEENEISKEWSIPSQIGMFKL